ncbi:hypothetical protein PV326_000621, partial [Microctonus aethiopoides]
KDLQIDHQWTLRYKQNTHGQFDMSKIKPYSNYFESNLIPNVKFAITCVQESNIYYVILSKTQHTPVSATVAIEFIAAEQIKRIVHIDRWTNYCTFDVNTENLLPDARSQAETSTRDSLCNRFKNFLTVPDLSDMTIVIDEKEIPVHRIILAVSSPVFLAMFKTDMAESVNKRIVITAIEVDIMKKVIEFMYTNVLDPIPEFNDLLSILEVADRYQIMTLKELCEEKLSENMTIDNVLKILERASLYGVPQLMETLITFMVEEKLRIVAMEEFADLYRRKPEILFEFIIRSIAIN